MQQKNMPSPDPSGLGHLILVIRSQPDMSGVLTLYRKVSMTTETFRRQLIGVLLHNHVRNERHCRCYADAMRKTYLHYFLAALLLIVPLTRTATAAPQNKQRMSAEEVKIKVAKLGLGSKAKATAWLTNGTKVKGYIAQAGDSDFVLRDRETDIPTTINYADVTRLDHNRGHSTAKWVGLGVGIGVGAVILIVFATIAHLD